jgi:hypothetical protein
MGDEPQSPLQDKWIGDVGTSATSAEHRLMSGLEVLQRYMAQSGRLCHLAQGPRLSFPEAISALIKHMPAEWLTFSPAVANLPSIR